MGTKRGNDLHDHTSREQTPEGVGVWPAQSGSVVTVDSGEFSVGTSADESGAMGGVREKPSQMEQVIFVEAVWRAFAQCFLTHDEAVQAIDNYRRGLLRSYAGNKDKELK